MRSGVPWSIVLCEHSAHGIFVDVDAEDMSNLLGDAHAAELGVAPLHLDNHRDELRGRTLGTGLAPM